MNIGLDIWTSFVAVFEKHFVNIKMLMSIANDGIPAIREASGNYNCRLVEFAIYLGPLPYP